MTQSTPKQPTQDTPGRPNPASSRQQTHPDQAEQSGTPAIDANSRHTAKSKDVQRPAKK